MIAAASADDIVGRAAAANEARSNALGAIKRGPPWLQAALRVRVFAASVASGDVDTAGEALETLAGASWRSDTLSLAIYEAAAASPLLRGGVAEERHDK